MPSKSLPTFKHASIGSKTHKARTATAHVSYIMRSEAMTMFQAQNMPDGGRGTRVFFDKLWEKAGMPDHARIADKLMIALPVELTAEQRHEAVRSFMQELGKGRIAWCAAHHDRGEDAHNPHAHIVFKDADIDTGRKVIGTTTSSRDVREAKEHGWKVPPRTTTADMRKMWCEHLNAHMERAGLDIRYDPRTLKEQGIDREAQIHVGPKAQALEEKGHAFTSKDRMRGEHSLPYTLFDEASRAVHNKRIIESNQERASLKASSPQRAANFQEDQEKRRLRDMQVQTRRAVYKQQQLDRDALRLAQDAAKREHQDWAKRLYAGAREAAYQSIKEQYADKWEAVRAIEDLKQREKAAAALKLEQKKTYQQEAKQQIEQCRPQKDAAWKAMLEKQEKERLDLRALHHQETTALARQQAAQRFGVYEKFRGFRLDKTANRIDGRLTAHQGMAAQQKAALDMIKLNDRANQPANSPEAQRGYFATARVEQAMRAAVRDKLDKIRKENLQTQLRLDPSLRRQPAADRAAANAAANGKASPRDRIVPGLNAARASGASKLQQRLNNERNPQEQIRQAASSGRQLTDAEHANASPELREQLAREQRAARVRAFISAAHQQQSRDRGGRTGGGRGR